MNKKLLLLLAYVLLIGTQAVMAERAVVIRAQNEETNERFLYFYYTDQDYTWGDYISAKVIVCECWEGSDVTDSPKDSKPAWHRSGFVFDKIYISKAFRKNVKPKSLAYWFYKAREIRIEGDLNTSEVTSMYHTFDHCDGGTSFENWDTGNVTTMEGMFLHYENDTYINVEKWNTSKVTNMHEMFKCCFSLTTIKGLENLDTHNVTDMSDMFYSCENLKGIDLSSFNTNKVTDMSNMFYSCEELTHLDLTSFNTSKVTDMSEMFDGCKKLKTIDIGWDWSTKNVTNSENMFGNCNNITGGNGTKYNESMVDMTYARNDGGSTSESPGYMAITAPYIVWCEDNTMLCFDYGHPLAKGGKYNNMDVSKAWSARNVFTSYIGDNSEPRASCTDVVLTEAFTDNYKPTDMTGWFANLSKLTTFTGLTNLDTSETTLMKSVFQGCTSLSEIDLSTWDTHNVTDMQFLFSSCTNLKTIKVGDYWSVASVSDTKSMFMFYDCNKLVGGNGTTYDSNVLDCTYAKIDGGTASPGYLTGDASYAVWCNGNKTLYFDFGNPVVAGDKYDGQTVTDVWYGKRVLDTSGYPEWYDKKECTTVVYAEAFKNAKPTRCYQLFWDFSKLTSIKGLENLNTSNINNMSKMFGNCSSLTELDLRGFDTSNVTDMSMMFYACSNLKTIYVGKGWTTTSGANCLKLFKGCTSLVGGNGTPYDSQKTGEEYAREDGGLASSTPGYFSVLSPYAIYQGTTLYFDYGTPAGIDGTYKGAAFSGLWRDEDLIRENTPAYGSVVNETCTDVVINEAFKDARPVSLAYWFGEFKVLTSVTGLEYLNTSEATSMEGMFMSCQALTGIDVTKLDTRTITDMESMFYNCSKLESIDLSTFDTRNVTNLRYFLYNCKALTSIDLSSWNTDNVKWGDRMFRGCKNLASVNLSGWKLAKAVNLHSQFKDCVALTTLDLRGYNIAKVTNMSYMFDGCSKLETIIVGDGWSTESVTEGDYMFRDCTNIVGENGTMHTTSNISQKYYDSSTFARIDQEETPGYLSHYISMNNPRPQAIWCKSNSTLYFDYGAPPAVGSNYGEGTVSHVWRGKQITNSPTEGVPAWQGHIYTSCTTVAFTEAFKNNVRPTSLAGWFSGFYSLRNFKNLENLNTESVTSMNSMLYNSKLTLLDIRTFDTHNVTDMREMFYLCDKLQTIIVGDGWSTEHVRYSGDMFKYCNKLIGENGTLYDGNSIGKLYARVDRDGAPGYLSHYETINDSRPRVIWCKDNKTLYFDCTTPLAVGDTYNDQTITALWTGCHINNTPTDAAPAWNDEVNGTCNKVVFAEALKSNNVKPATMYRWFASFKKLKTIEGWENLDASEATSMNRMFYHCTGLESLDLSGCDAGNVTTMESMFEGCTNLAVLDLGNWNTVKLKNMSSMFSDCSALTTVNFDGFNTANVTSIFSMFQFCTSLESIDLSGWNTGNMNSIHYLFYNCSNLKSVNLSNWDTGKVGHSRFMFAGCTNLTTLLGLTNWNVESLNYTEEMFSDCVNLFVLDLSGWNTKFSNAEAMFHGCTNLKAIIVGDGWSNEQMRASDCRWMFNKCPNLVGEDGTMVASGNHDQAYAHTGEGGLLTKKTISLPVTNNGGDGYYYSTYFKSNVNRQADEDTEVFIGTLDEGRNELKLTKVDDRIIMAGEGVILRRASSGDATLTSVFDESTADYTTNMLDGVERTTPTSDISGTVYVLNKVDNKLGFFHYIGENLKGQKAYLAIDGSMEAPGFVFNFGGEYGTTPVSETVIVDHEDAAANWYTIDGYKLQGKPSKKGLYIRNGSKVVIK